MMNVQYLRHSLLEGHGSQPEVDGTVAEEQVGTEAGAPACTVVVAECTVALHFGQRKAVTATKHTFYDISDGMNKCTWC